MKYVKCLIFVTGVVIFDSCQPAVVFNEAQPVNVESLSEIPDAYRGIFWCPADSASLFIDDKAFIKRKELLVKLTKAEVDSSNDLYLSNGRLFITEWEADFPAEEKGDTIVSQLIIRDTIFALGPKQVLKDFKGHLVLSTKLDEGAWAVSVASQTGKGILKIARADLPENLEALDSIVPINSVSKINDRETQILIRPTKEQFERILQKGVLFQGSCTEFERILPIPHWEY
ncbi:hypothetical protein ACFQZJ_07670 [Maribacter chungangensis]|uniref:Uncharacterized protein n=1 Tax=Maribacter chungangensis TaxID=1069117 RepID=A0ABW3B269_9FLAO